MRRAFKCVLVCDWCRGFILPFRVSNLSSSLMVSKCTLRCSREPDTTRARHLQTHVPTLTASAIVTWRRSRLSLAQTNTESPGRGSARLVRARTRAAGELLLLLLLCARSFTCKQRHKGEEWWERQRGCGVDGKQRPDGTSQRVISPFAASHQLL